MHHLRVNALQVHHAPLNRHNLRRHGRVDQRREVAQVQQYEEAFEVDRLNLRNERANVRSVAWKTVLVVRDDWQAMGMGVEARAKVWECG